MKRKATTILGLISVVATAAVATPALAGHRGGDDDGHAKSDHRNISMMLTGSQVPGGGDADGAGSARFMLRPQHAEVCFELRWKRLDGVVTAAHIHQGRPGAVGPHHIDLFDDEHFVGRRNAVSGCVQVPDGEHGSTATADEKIGAVIERPEDYYLNVHSSAFPDGAIRGQLSR